MGAKTFQRDLQVEEILNTYAQPGFCPVCKSDVVFSSKNPWFRDHLNCPVCRSLPRHRALALSIREKIKKIDAIMIHESSPSVNGCGQMFKGCDNYIPSHFFGDSQETFKNGFRNENLEKLTFKNESMDLHIHSDVLEHVNNPEAVIKEAYRTLRPGGLTIFSVPVYVNKSKTEPRATHLKDGSIKNLTQEPLEYHGNPIGKNSLVTHHYGQDLHQLIGLWSSGFTVEMRRYFSHFYGIVGEFTDILVCSKKEINQ